MQLDKQILDRANEWLSGNFDEITKSEIRMLLENDPVELTDSFYKDLEFGTGGLRGIMGPGTNRMNKYTVGMATQGLANYLKKVYNNGIEIKAAIAYDCRNNNTLFARVTANVLSANGIKVYLFDELKPTPELSFAIRHLKCQTGIVITASHNPKEYNGYKVYWSDGGQLINPHDQNIIEEVKKIKSIDDVNFDGESGLIATIGSEIDKIYLQNIKSLSLNPDIVKNQSKLKIVYTPIHGTGVKLVPEALKLFGFQNVYNVPEQDIVSGDFPTVHSPNPEEPAALSMAIQKAKDVDADLLFATDPDSDRVGVAVKNTENNYTLLNGNQTASLLIFYLLSEWNDKNKIKGKEFIAKTIVTTELLDEIAASFKVPSYDVLTGFKYIADIIKRFEGEKTFIGGGEESYGYLVGDFVRDKDAVISCCMIAETASWAMNNGMTMLKLLENIHRRYGLYKESLISVVRKGKKGAEEIQEMMTNFREHPKKTMNGSPLVMIKDYKMQKSTDLKTNQTSKISLPKSNVIQFFLEDGSKITVRPSGTEPKIKFYFSVNETIPEGGDYHSIEKHLDEKLKRLAEEFSNER